LSVYEELGVRRVINARGPATISGGSVLDPEVVEAIKSASQWFVDMNELHRKAGQRIAELIGVEAAYVTSSCAAALVLATAACVAGKDPAKIRRLPDTEGMKNEVIIQKGHLCVYEHCFRAPGTKLIEVGFPHSTEPWEIEEAINEKTAAIAYVIAPLGPFVGDTQMGMVPLKEVVRIAKKHGIPVIVDAANMVPPKENLWKYVHMGADLVAFSGGKLLRGLNSTGLLLGRRDLVEAAAMQGTPNIGIGRPMKVSKEQIVAMVKALEIYMRKDESAERKLWEERVQFILNGLRDIPFVKAERVFPTLDNRPIPKVHLAIREKHLGRTAREIVEILKDGDPIIHVQESLLDKGVLILDPSTLLEGDEKILVERLKKVLKN